MLSSQDLEALGMLVDWAGEVQSDL
jgi:hypothetical protein